MPKILIPRLKKTFYLSQPWTIDLQKLRCNRAFAKKVGLLREEETTQTTHYQKRFVDLNGNHPVVPVARHLATTTPVPQLPGAAYVLREVTIEDGTAPYVWSRVWRNINRVWSEHMTLTLPRGTEISFTKFNLKATGISASVKIHQIPGRKKSIKGVITTLSLDEVERLDIQENKILDLGPGESRFSDLDVEDE